ncbi:MAG TPA: hydantoinase/oxoprolinase family protein [Solirubrobacteraceae bacterium]|jgi:N-methylhydantoinase A|nr:hydantoinase/oxoprolinase family protein [Solirubrobacteraceae bacterium]
MPTARITCDIGGTFTDVVVSDEGGRMTIAKALTRPARLFDGLRAALARAAEELDEPLAGLLGRASLFIFSTTQATNAILEGTTARTAFLCTEGFPDILVRREGGSLRPYDYSRPFPEPYVPRRLTLEIAERIDAEGNVLLPLDQDSARAQLSRARELTAEAVSVCLLWSTANPAHELALGELIARELPGVPYSLSHQINPIVREYRRASGTSIDASLKPLMQRHLPEISSGLEGEGFAGELLAASSAGGVVPMAELIQSPLWSVRSGPSLAPVAARTVARAEAHSDDAIVCDTGGTSFDVSLVRAGDLVFTSETWLGEPFAGHLTGLSSVDVRSIGAGGGSIAWVDPGGLLRVGPESARADPGPACYGLGGTRPTVTDAALVLGYIDPGRFLGGKMALDVGAAETALGELSGALGVGLREAAHAVLSIANERMIAAIHELTVNEGVDPRDSTLVAGGGAAGLTILSIARELGCREVLVPRAAGVLSAFGGQHSDIVREMTAPHVTNSVEFDYEGVRATLDGLRERMDAFESELPAGLAGAVQRRYFVEARYAYQVWDLSIPLEGQGIEDEAALTRLIESFHDAHERIFAVREPGQKIELSQWKGRVTASTVKPPLAVERSEAGGAESEVPGGEASVDVGAASSRVAYFPELGEVEIAVHEGRDLRAGGRVQGPALIIEPETTIVVYPGWTAQVSELGNYRLELEDA